MPPVKKAFVPQLMFSPISSQRDDPGLDQARSQIDKRGSKKRRKNAAEKTTSALKVQLGERNTCALFTKKKKTKTKWTQDPTARKNKTTLNQERPTQSVNPALVDGDVYYFSEPSNSQMLNEKEKAKHSVLRTISKMLQENHLIRNRLATLSQAK